MIVLNVFLEVNEKSVPDYLKLTEDLVLKSNNETGCSYYHHYKSVGSDTRFIIVENWESQEALDAHNQSEHFKNFVNKINNFLSEDLVINTSISN